MKIYFTGSDVFLLNHFPEQEPKTKLPYVIMYREFIRASKRFAEEFWVVHEHLIPELNQFGIREKIKVVPHPLEHTRKYCKFPHKGFNLFYYCPFGEDIEWNKWIYGYDIYLKVKEHFPDINFIESNDWRQFDMAETYPIIDFCLRCNRHDGDARLVRECKIQEIPFYWSYENPDFDEIIKSIENAKTGRHKD